MTSRPSLLLVLRVLGAVMLLLGSVPLLVAGPAAAAAGSSTIEAKALADHECDDTEWHFVITQIDEANNAPDSITVTWANSAAATVPLDKVTGDTAHYTTTANLDSTVTSATGNIYAGWSGQFNLSHGPCGEPEDTPTSAVRPSVTQAICTENYAQTTPSFTVHNTVGVGYYMADTKVTGTVDAVAGTTVTVTAKAQDGYDLVGHTTFELVFSANPACEKPGDIQVLAVSPSLTQAECTKDFTLTTPSFTVDATVGVDYYVGAVKVSGTVDAVAGSTVTVTAQARDGHVLTGPATFKLVFTANPACERPGDQHVPVNVCHATGSATTPYVFITVDDDSADFQGHLTHRNSPRPNTPADLIADYTDAEGVFHAYDGEITGLEDCGQPAKITPLTKQSAVNPVFVDSVCLPGSLGSSQSASYTVASTVGIDYYLGEVKLAAGTYDVADGSSVTITAKAQTGFLLEGVSSFTHTFPVPVCSSGTTITTGTAGTTVGTPVEIGTQVTEDSAVLGDKTGQTLATASAESSAAGTLPHTGAGLPVGISLTGGILLLTAGGLMIALSRRRTVEHSA